MNKLKLAFLGIAALLFAFSCATSPSPNAPIANTNVFTNPSPAATVDELASGRKLYMENCMICHKENGTGGRTEIEGKKINAENLTSDKMKKESDDDLIKEIYNGIPDEGMPAFKNKLSEAEIREVVRYIRKTFHGQ